MAENDHQLGSRNGPRFSINHRHMVRCDWGSTVPGVMVWDNHDGFAMGRAYCLAPDIEVAEYIVAALNELNSPFSPPPKTSAYDTENKTNETTTSGRR